MQISASHIVFFLSYKQIYKISSQALRFFMFFDVSSRDLGSP